MATSVLGLKTFAASDPVDYNDVNDNYTKIDNGVKTAMQGRAAYNHIDNSNFQINQRGASSVTTNWTYFIDRWLAPSASASTPISVSSSGLTISNKAGTATMSLRQYIENIPNGTYTAAADANGVVYWQVFTVNDGAVRKGANGFDGKGQIYINISETKLQFNLQAFQGNDITFKWAALYEGSYTADTLPAYQPKGYAAELAECQRYYQVFGKKRLIQSTEPNGGFTISERFPIAMRVAPTIMGTYVAWATLASGPSAVVEKTDRLSTNESRADGFIGYYAVGIAKEIMILDYAFTASADL